MKKVLVIRSCSECHLKCDERTNGSIPEYCPLPGIDLLFSEMANLHIGLLEQRIAELEEPILCHKCNDHIDGDGAICGACASTQDIVINEQRERIAELEREEK